MNEIIKLKLEENAIITENYYNYIELIETAIAQNRVKLPHNNVDYIYYEAHHILPRCLFKEYEKLSTNIVLLTAREHLLAHFYLTQIFNDSRLDFAYWRLCTDGRGRNVTPEEYEAGKLLAISRSSELNTGRKLSKQQINKMLNTKRKNGTLQHSQETKRKISESNKGKEISQAQREKIRKAHLGKHLPKWSQERKDSLSEKRKGENNPMFGKHVKDFMTEDAYKSMLLHISESLKGHVESDETRQKISEKLKISSAFIGGKNPKAKRIKCIEDDVVFDTLKDCALYYNIPRYLMTEIAKSGEYLPLNKHFEIV